MRSQCEAATFVALVPRAPRQQHLAHSPRRQQGDRRSPSLPTARGHRSIPREPKPPINTPKTPTLTRAGAALPVLCGVLVFRHHLWHVHGRVRRPWHGEGLLPLLLQRVRGRGRPMGSCLHGRGRRRQGRALVRGRHRRGGRR